MSKYDTDICPFCEKPVATYKEDKQYEKRLYTADDNYDDPELGAWADQYCWRGWAQPGDCRNGMSIEDRLIEVLEQRDEARGILTSRPF